MPVVTVRVPAGQVAAVRRELVNLYAVEAQSVHHAVIGFLSDGEPLESLFGHREELLEFDRLLAQVGWRSLSGPADDVELRGERRLLSCVLHGVLIDLAEEVATGSDRRWRGERTTDQLRKPARGVLELLSLLDGLDPAGAVDEHDADDVDVGRGGGTRSGGDARSSGLDEPQSFREV
ncbi:MAG: hypothetical protein ACREX8_08260 [Gammaproteobacteria bacterium]